MEKDNFKKIIKAWKEAQSDLKIEIVTPFILELSKDNFIEYNLLIKKFGSALGTIIITTEDMRSFKYAKDKGYYCSALSPISYSKYNKEMFIETLNDWGFFGNENEIPYWYAGQS